MKNFIALCLAFNFIGFINGQIGYSRTQLQQYIQNQDYGSAIQLLKTVKPDKFDKEYNLNLGYAYFMNDEEKNALPAYQVVYEREPSNVQANLYLAIIYQRMKKYTDALGFYKNLTLLQPDQYKYWLYASSMFSVLDEKDSAFAYAEKAYLLNPKAANVVLRYSSLLSSKKEEKKAITIIDDFLKTDSTHEDVIARKISYSSRNSKYEEVIFWGEKLLRDSANEPLAFTDLAYAYLNTKQYDKSLSLSEWMNLKNMANELLSFYAALCYAEKKEYGKSNTLLDECLSQNMMPNAVTYFRSKADNYEKLNNYKKAIAQYDSAYYIFHKPLDMYYKGRVYDVFLNSKQQASTFYKKYITEQKTPQNDSEMQIFNYIKEYVKP